MISITELSEVWNSIAPHPGRNVGRRADDTHPLDFFITYDENSNMQMMLLSDLLPKVPPSSQQILVRANHRNDGKYALCFSLTDKTLRDQYISLCWDIMNCSSRETDSTKGLRIVVKRFCLWQKLLSEAKNKKLSDTEIKGLIGELCSLKNVLLCKYPHMEAISGWIGAIGADRDFELSDTWYEAKAVSLSRDSVTISSLDQLDIDDTGHLLILRVEKVSDNTPGYFTLNSLVNEVRALLSDTESRILFDARLSSTCFSPADPRSNDPYVLHGIESYWVDNDFPRIRRSEVSALITNGTYTLSIAALQPWRDD